MFHISQILTITTGALIPIVNNLIFIDDINITIISSILAGIIVAIAGLLSFTKAQESWILFRSAAENLKRDYHRYMQKAGDYSDSNLDDTKRDKMFINRAEYIFSEDTKYFSLRRESNPSGTSS